MEGNEQTTLHDSVSAAFDAVIPDAANPPAFTPESVPLPGAPSAAPVEAAPAGETPEAKAARERDEQGRFTKAKEPAAAQPKAATPPPPAQAAQAPALAAEPKKLNRPSSWKKEHWEAFDKLAAENPAIAEYILQRETEAARGVSTYKAEWDKARPILDAVAPYLPLFQQHGITDPGRQFAHYAEIHKGLALGSEEQKLGTILRLAQDYKIPMEKLFVQQNGQVFYNPQVQPAQAPQPQQQAVNPQSIEATVQAVIAKERTAAEIAAMSQDATKYPHFETVRPTMAQLLDAGLATDLPGAYDMALALPQHRELVAAAQQQQAAQAEADRKAKQAADAQRARAAAVSPRSATPATAPAQARKGLRDTIAEQVEAVSASRV